MMLYKNQLNESFNNTFIRDIILNNEYLKYIPNNAYKPTDIVEILRNHTTYNVYEDNSIYYKIEKAYNDLYIAYSKLLKPYTTNFLQTRNDSQNEEEWDITKYFNESLIIKDQNILGKRVKEIKVKFNNFIKLMNDFNNGTFNVTLDTPETKRLMVLSKLRDDQIQNITDQVKQNLNDDTLDFYIDKTLKPVIQEQKSVIMTVDKSNNSFDLFGCFNHTTPYILRYIYSAVYIVNKSSLKKIKKYWKDILMNDITTYKINDDYEIPFFKNITHFSYIQDEFRNFIYKNHKSKISNAESGYPLSILYGPIKNAALNNNNIYILDVNDSINKAYELPFIKHDSDLSNKNIVIKNSTYYHPLKTELTKFLDIWKRVYNYLNVSDVIDEKTLDTCDSVFNQLYEYQAKHSFVMRKPLNYNVILMHNRIYDILNTNIKPLVLDIYNIIRNNGNLTIKQQNKINDIISNIISLQKNINTIVNHNYV